MSNGKNMDNKEIPHNPSVESSVLGCVIFNNESFSEISGIITGSDFYSSVHEKIYNTIASSLREGGVVDDIVLESKLKSLNMFDEIGGTEYIKKIKSSACHHHMVRGYSKIIKDLSLKRSVIEVTDKYNRLASNQYSEDDAKSLISSMIGDISSVTVGEGASSGFSSTDEIVDDLFNGETGRVIETGLHCLDSKFPIMTSGITIIAGRPSHGKSTLAVALAKGMAQKDNRVDVYSFEMTKKQLAARLVSSELKNDNVSIPYINIYRPDLKKELSDEDIAIVKDTARNLPRINWNDATTMTTSDIICNSLYTKDIKDKPDVIIVDYLNKVSKSDMKGSELRDDQKVGEVIKRLRDFGKNHDCAVIVVVQLSRKVEANAEMGRPFLGGLKNSGEIEEHADMVLFSYRKCRYLEQKYGDDFDDDELYNEYLDLKGKMEIICAKQRMGPTGSQMVDCAIESNYIACEVI